MSVIIRKRQNKNGKTTLYLEINKKGQKRAYQNLNLFLHTKPTKAIEKQHNKKVSKIANSIRLKKELELIEDKNGGSFFDDGNFLTFFKSYSEKKQGNYPYAYKAIIQVFPNLKFNEITPLTWDFFVQSY